MGGGQEEWYTLGTLTLGAGSITRDPLSQGGQASTGQVHHLPARLPAATLHSASCGLRLVYLSNVVLLRHCG